MWIDTHCHLDAPEFGEPTERDAVRDQARRAGVEVCICPTVTVASGPDLLSWVRQTGDAMAWGVHPLWSAGVTDEDLAQLDQGLRAQAHDRHLVAVGEIGLDHALPEHDPRRLQQTWLFDEQLRLAHQHGLPVILHVRRAVDAVLLALRRAVRQGRPVPGGIAHAFNGSAQQAHALMDLGFCLGFGGAVTYERALHLRRLWCGLPVDALVLETDAPDMPPQWLYVDAARRAAGAAMGRNAPAELPAIAALLAQMRGLEVGELAQRTRSNAVRVLPRLSLP